MLFNSFRFLVFFHVVTICYFIIPHKFRWLFLLVSSCIFYMAFIPVYILILFFTIAIDYVAGIMIEKELDPGRRKRFLTISIVMNIAVLCVFKYYNFFIGDMNEVMQAMHLNVSPIPLLGIILPLGLSFHTFQAMSYTIEVYRGNQKAERHLGIYALYVMFYPQLVAGPIERPQNLIHQFREKHYFDSARVSSGLKLMLWGMFKKVIIADRISLLTTPVFDAPHNYPSITLCMATVFFSFQIFCDFSGYTDIAIGAARVMGFTLMRNFNWPYISTSVVEFWRRWHISLSTWFKDYLYFSLGGNRVSIPRWYFNVFIVFLISGLWHGANLTFVLWGAIHGLYFVFGKMISRFKERKGIAIPDENKTVLNRSFQIITTFLLVTFVWIFFKAKTVKDAFYIAGKIPFVFSDVWHCIRSHSVALFGIWNIRDIDPKYLLITIALIGMLVLLHSSRIRKAIVARFTSAPFVFRFLAYFICTAIIWYSFSFRQPETFIYFQF